MKTTKILPAIACAMLFAAVVTAAPSVGYKINMKSGSKVWLEGNSTLHPYESIATNVLLDTKMSYNPDGSGLKKLQTLVVLTSQISKCLLVIPVTNLHSPTWGLDPYLYDTMKYKEYPDIVFSISNYTVAADAKTAGRYVIRAFGSLKIAGKEKPETLDAIADVNDKTIKVVGQTTVRMTDFGIKPPNMMFGTIVCDDKIDVKWDLTVSAESLTNISIAMQ
ncbi:MAG: YceI family protein [Spirochaetes bacterium]|nr:YceI family protein [Spirochaetota bacterium]